MFARSVQSYCMRMKIETVRRRLQIGETFATLIAAEEYMELAERAIVETRTAIRDYIDSNPGFAKVLEPFPVEPGAPDVIRRMASAAGRMSVGPMAAVAGAVAQLTVERLLEAGAEHVIMDNGGDIVMKIDRTAVVGLFAGNASVRNMGFSVEPRPGIISICTSSGRVGHSLSFGSADAAVVIAADGFLADAAATALGNRIQTGEEEEIEAAVNDFLLEGIEGILVVAGERIGMGGELPAIVRVSVNPDLISRGTGEK